MRHLGAEVCHTAAGVVRIRLRHGENLTQQHGYFHAGATTAIADTAGGYAALSVQPPGSDVLTVSFNLHLISPAAGTELIATGTVVRAGRTLTTCTLSVITVDGPEEKLVAVGQQTVFRISARP